MSRHLFKSGYGQCECRWCGTRRTCAYMPCKATNEMRLAIKRYAIANGRSWKSKLDDDRMNGRLHEVEGGGDLQAFTNAVRPDIWRKITSYMLETVENESVADSLAPKDDGFKSENIDGTDVQVKRLAFGGQVHRDEDCFDAFDAAGNFLGGLISSLENAEYAAQKGFVVRSQVDGVNELDLWPLWNEAVSHGARVLQDENGLQLIHLGDGVFMTARDDEHGWDVKLIDDTNVERDYWDATHECFALRIITKAAAFVLE